MKERIHSIDIVRGLIMIIMTLDHTRDFLHYPGNPPLNMQTTTGFLFFTRWITHFCAPGFVFLSGVSAYLAGQRRTKNELSLFLLKRGAWLICSDLLIVSLLFSFDLRYHMLILEVLWATGFGMILLGFLLRAPMAVIATVAMIILFGHNALDYMQLPPDGLTGSLVKLFLTAPDVFIPLSADRAIVVLYSAIPWSAILLLGYSFGALYKNGYDASKRKSILRHWGFSAILLFIVLRLINYYGDPSPWSTQRNTAHTILSFLNTTKQSPSLLFLLMTIGPILLLLSFTEKTINRLGEFCRVYGHVPYFYFIIHLSLLRLLNIVLALLSGLPMKSDGSPIVWQVQGFGIPLWQVYLIWIAVALMLYYPCRWYGHYKRTHSQWWLSFL